MTTPTPRIRDTLLTALDITREEIGWSNDLDEARRFVLAMERLWPTLDGVPDGIDRFAEHEVTGEEQLADYRRTRHEILRQRAKMGCQDAITALRLEYGEESPVG